MKGRPDAGPKKRVRLSIATTVEKEVFWWVGSTIARESEWVAVTDSDVANPALCKAGVLHVHQCSGATEDVNEEPTLPPPV